MNTSRYLHSERSKLRRWQRVLAVAGVLLLGAEVSEARASCGDYLHNGSTASSTAAAGSPHVPAQSRCKYGRCEGDPIPTRVPPAPVQNAPTDDVTDVEWTTAYHSTRQSSRLDRATLDPTRPGHPVRIDRPPRG
jgi:hypothetical protein